MRSERSEHGSEDRRQGSLPAATSQEARATRGNARAAQAAIKGRTSDHQRIRDQRERGEGVVKLYIWGKAPNPRRVLIYLEEKGIDVPLEDVGGGKGRLKPEYLARYPQATVPMLELDDGTQIGEAMAICRYFEELHPDPPLMGTDAAPRSIVEMWEGRADEGGVLPGAARFR